MPVAEFLNFVKKDSTTGGRRRVDTNRHMHPSGVQHSTLITTMPVISDSKLHRFDAMRFRYFVWSIALTQCLTEALDAVCFESTDTETISCPSVCPYSSYCSGSESTTCVRAQDCSLLGTGGNAVNNSGTLSCAFCSLSGCVECASSSACEVCDTDYDLIDGECSWKYSTVFYGIIAGVVALFCWIVIDLFLAHCFSGRNPDSVRAGLIYRAHAKMRDAIPNHPFHSLFVRLHTQPFGGPGIPLFFNWFLLIMVVGVYMCILAAIFIPDDSHYYDVSNVCSDITVSDPSDPANTELSVSRSLLTEGSTSNKVWTGLNYFGVALITFVFFFIQHKLWVIVKDDDEEMPVLARFAVEARGFPKNAVDAGELAAFWREALSVMAVQGDIMDISIAYDFSSDTDEVQRLIDQHIRQREMQLAGYTSGHAAQMAEAAERREVEMLEDNKWTCAGTFWTQVLSYIMLGTDIWCCNRRLKGYYPLTPPIDQYQATQLLNSLQGSGTAFFLHANSETVQQVCFEKKLPILFRGRHEIWVHRVHENPLGVQWANYGIPRSTLRARGFVFVIAMIVVLFLWAALYWPWAYLSYKAIGTDDSSAYISDYLLSLLIALGNGLVSYCVVLGMSRYGFRKAGNERLAYLLIIVPCVLINVVADIVITVYVCLSSISQELVSDSEFFWSCLELAKYLQCCARARLGKHPSCCNQDVTQARCVCLCSCQCQCQCQCLKHCWYAMVSLPHTIFVHPTLTRTVSPKKSPSRVDTARTAHPSAAPQ